MVEMGFDNLQKFQFSLKQAKLQQYNIGYINCACLVSNNRMSNVRYKRPLGKLWGLSGNFFSSLGNCDLFGG